MADEDTVDLESILRKLLNIVQLPYDLDDGDHYLKLIPPPDNFNFSGICLHVAKYAQNSHAIIVKHQSADFDTYPPRDHEDFVRGRYFALIKEHHVVLLHIDGLRRGTCKRAGRLLASEHPHNQLTADERQALKTLKLLPPIQTNALQQIQQKGVKEIITTQLVPASFVAEQRRRGTFSPFEIVANWLGLAGEERVRLLEEPGQLRFRNSIKPATRKTDIRAHELEVEQTLAASQFNDSDDDLIIILGNDTRLTRNEMEYRKVVQFNESHPGDVSAQDAFNELLAYYNELRNGGALD